MIGSLNFLGMIVGSVLFIHLADVYGRKKTLLIGGSTYYLLGISLYFVTDLYSLYVIDFLFGMACLVRAMSSYMLSMELVPDQYRREVSLVIMFFDSSTYVVNALCIGYGKSY